MASSDWVLVDDADPRIQYSSGWQAFENGAELDGTKHGAAAAGLTASFGFTGTQVIVVGSLGSVDVHGIPTTLYALDGVEAGSYTAPIVDPGFFRLNVTFFSSKTLAPGDHTLVITNVNGTSPNVFWLDYVEYIPSAASITTTSSSSSSSSATTIAASSSPASSLSTSSSTSQPPATSSTSSASNQAESSTASQSTTSSTTAAAAPPSNPTSPPNADTSTASTSHTHAGAIAGGIVGGAALVLALALLLVYLRRRRRQKGESTLADPPIRPFGSWRGPDEAQVLPASPSQKQMNVSMSMSMMAGASTPTLSTALPTPTGLSPPPTPNARPPPSEFPWPATEQRQSPTSSELASFGMGTVGGRQQAAGRSEPRVMQTVDSGLRLQAGEAVMLPPPYTRE